MKHSLTNRLVALGLGFTTVVALGALRSRKNQTPQKQAQETTMKPESKSKQTPASFPTMATQSAKENKNILANKTRFLLIRHGQTSWNTAHRMQGHADIPLNDVGHAQAKAMAEQLSASDHTIKGVYASDLKRAVDTAHPICSKVGRTVTTCPELREIHVGEAQGLTPDERDKLHGTWRNNLDILHPTPDARWEHPEWPGGESKKQLLNRVTCCLEKLAEKHRGEEVAIVSHAGVIYTLVESITKKMYDIPNCSATHIVYDPSNKTQPFAFEKVQHLEGLEGCSQKTVQVQL